MGNNKIIPPRLANRFLNWFLKSELAEEVLGDLNQQFYLKLEETSRFRAKVNYWFQVIHYLRPFAIRNLNNNFQEFNQYAMIRSYFILGWRNIKKNKVFSLINILGLATGMAACLLILKYVSFELSYDDFRNPNVYRLSDYGYMHGELVGKHAETVPALAPALQRDIPEVIAAARLVHTSPFMSDPVMQANDRSFHEDRVYFADSSLLKMFSYRMLEGSPNEALRESNSVVISRSMENKYFPGQNALDKSLTFYEGSRGKVLLKITGVFTDIPPNSHVHTDFLISFSTLPWDLDNDWGWGNFYNYIELRPGTPPAEIKQKIPAVLQKYQGKSIAELQSEGYVRKYDLQPIQSIHLDSHLETEAEANGSRTTVTFFSIIAIFILVIAWINYVNLTTARSGERAREIGIRKVVGSNRKQLIGQFLSESLITSTIAALVAVALSQLLMPWFRTITHGHFATDFNVNFVIAVFGLFLAGTIISSFYPAFVLSSYKPLQVLKGSIKNSSGGVNLRKSLVVFQFASSIALIIGTFAVRQQLRYMHRQNLGLNIKQSLIVKGPGVKDSTYQAHLDYFREEMSSISGVQSVAVSSSIPGKELVWARDFSRQADPQNTQGINILAIDENFFRLYDAQFLAGRNFSKELSGDRNAVILNETAVKDLGFKNAEDAAQKTVLWHESDNDIQPKIVVGVVRDFNQESLHKKVGPIVFALKKYLDAPWAGEFYSVKLDTKDIPATIVQVKEKWESAFPGSPFDYFFLDDYFNNQYQSDQQFEIIFSLFSLLAILIACLGLFGLSSYMILQRTKEIGIRKVLGATTRSVVTLLSRDFIQLVLIASILALPVIYYGVKSWLDHYAYHMKIHWWLLALPVLLVWILSLVTISIQAIKTSLSKPVTSLKYE